MISKVKTIVEIKERENKETKKTVFYHNCILEDWQKISLWKVVSWAIKEWDEIEYELVDDWKWGQKAKEVKKVFVKWWWFQKQKPNNAWFALAYAKDIAVAYIWQGEEWITTQNILDQATLFYNRMQDHDVVS
jgi:hypothetical protein